MNWRTNDMYYQVHKVANVDTIENTDLINRFWSIILKTGVKLSGHEDLVYIVDRRGDVFVFVNPSCSFPQSSIIRPVIVVEEGVDYTEINHESISEISTPNYFELYIHSYDRLVKCTDELSDDEMKLLTDPRIANDYVAIKSSSKAAHKCSIININDIADKNLKERCDVLVAKHGLKVFDMPIYLISVCNGNIDQIGYWITNLADIIPLT